MVPLVTKYGVKSEDCVRRRVDDAWALVWLGWTWLQWIEMKVRWQGCWKVAGGIKDFLISYTFKGYGHNVCKVILKLFHQSDYFYGIFIDFLSSTLLCCVINELPRENELAHYSHFLKTVECLSFNKPCSPTPHNPLSSPINFFVTCLGLQG